MKPIVDFAIKAARGEIKIPNLPDIHCWTFTPSSFAKLMSELASIGFMPFACERVYETEPYTFEFYAILRSCEDLEKAKETGARTDTCSLRPRHFAAKNKQPNRIQLTV